MQERMFPNTLVVHSGGEVLDEHVADIGLAQGGVSLGPHDAVRLALHVGEDHGVQSKLGITGVVVADVGIAVGTSGDL